MGPIMRSEMVFILLSVIIVLSSFVLLYSFSQQNTTFAKNLITTTNLAQEGINEILQLHDQIFDSTIKLPPCENILDPTITCADFALAVCDTGKACLARSSATYADPSWKIKDSQFFRKVRITDDKQGGKNVTVLVWWSDAKGIHKSALTRKLTKETTP